jgi:hypothetical protein
VGEAAEPALIAMISSRSSRPGLYCGQILPQLGTLLLGQRPTAARWYRSLE